MTLVSVLMPMRNAAPFVRAAVQSVLAQREVELELVVIDDGSTDGSGEIVRAIGDPRVRVLPGPCQGIAAGFNTALKAARGEFVARCDSDDLLPEWRLSWQLRWLNEHPDFGAICARFTTMTSAGKIVDELDCGGTVPEETTAELRAGKVRTSFCTYVVRTAVLRQIGGCRSWFVTAEDVDLQLRLGEATRVWFEPISCYFYRLHEASITHKQGQTRQAFFESAARTFQSQRQAGGPDDLERGSPPLPPDATWVRPDRPILPKTEIQGYLLGRAWREQGQGRRLKALRSGLRACLARPTNLGAWKSLMALLLKRPRPPQAGDG
jgi:GT2 family glycosyltransferase